MNDWLTCNVFVYEGHRTSYPEGPMILGISYFLSVSVCLGKALLLALYWNIHEIEWSLKILQSDRERIGKTLKKKKHERPESHC